MTNEQMIPTTPNEPNTNQDQPLAKDYQTETSTPETLRLIPKCFRGFKSKLSEDDFNMLFKEVYEIISEYAPNEPSVDSVHLQCLYFNYEWVEQAKNIRQKTYAMIRMLINLADYQQEQLLSE